MYVTSNTVNKIHAKDRYILIKQSPTNRSIAVTALLEHLDLHACFMLRCAGDYVSSNLMLQWWNSHKSLYICCNGQPLPRALLQCSHILLQFNK